MSSAAGLSADCIAARTTRGSRSEGYLMRAGIRHSFLCLMLVGSLALLCAGCLVGPDFSSPSAPVADKWLEAGNPSVDTRNQSIETGGKCSTTRFSTG